MSEDEIRAQICEFGDRVRLRAEKLKDPLWLPVIETDDEFDRDMRSILADVERKLDAIKAEES